MNTKQLQYVVTLAQERSFSKAADVLNISQPSLSQYIKKIEQEIGIELFDRANGNVRLTDAGKVYIDAGRKILDLEYQMKNAFIDLSAHKTGSLIIGAAPYRAASMMPAIAASFRSLHPGMHLVIREGTTAEIAEGMEHGEFDLALTLLPIDDKLFAWEKVVDEELVLAVPGSYPSFPTTRLPDCRYPAISVDAINDMGVVMLTEGQYMQNQLTKVLVDHRIHVHPAAVVKSLEAQIEFVKAGIGIALMPSGIERFCRDTEVTFYSFIQKLPKREVVVMWRRGTELSETVRELKNTILSIEW